MGSVTSALKKCTQGLSSSPYKLSQAPIFVPSRPYAPRSPRMIYIMISVLALGGFLCLKFTDAVQS